MGRVRKLETNRFGFPLVAQPRQMIERTLPPKVP